MELAIYFLIFFLAATAFIMGVRMIIDPTFRNDTASKWYKPQNAKEQESFQKSVKIMGGPLYILAGLLIFAFGIWLLDLHYGILRNLPVLRSIINEVVQ